MPQTTGLDKGTLLLIVGAAELLAALLIAVWPRVGGFVAMLGFWLIVANLLLIPGYYDVMIRDFGLSMAALATGLAAVSVARERTTYASERPLVSQTERRTVEEVNVGVGAGSR